jgi:hypothetical protein
MKALADSFFQLCLVYLAGCGCGGGGHADRDIAHGFAREEVGQLLQGDHT